MATVLRDRIRELRRVTARELLANPRNWRTHPEPQRAGLRAILERVGIVGALTAYESPEADGALTLIDGHLRQDEYPDTEWPVLILDVDTDDEADELLATLDPLAAMAEADELALAQLLESIKSDDEDLVALVARIGDESDPPAGESVFQPDEDPEIGGRQVTDADVEKKRLSLDDKYSGAAKRTVYEVICPSCAEEFTIDV